jgi:hypothetical protein
MTFCRMMVVWGTWGVFGLGLVSEAAACARCQHRMSLGLAPLSHGIPVSQAPMSYAPVYTPSYYVVSAPVSTGGTTTQDSLLGPLAAEFSKQFFKQVFDKILGSWQGGGGGGNPPSVDPESNSRLTRIEERLDRIEQKLEKRVTALEQATSDSLEAIKNNAQAIQGTQRETLALLLTVPSNKTIEIQSSLDDVWLISEARTGPRQVTIPRDTEVTVIATVGDSPDVVTFVRWKRDGVRKVGYVKGFKTAIEQLQKTTTGEADAIPSPNAGDPPSATIEGPSKAAPKNTTPSDSFVIPPA